MHKHFLTQELPNTPHMTQFCSTGASSGPEFGVFVILLIGCLVLNSFSPPFLPHSPVETHFSMLTWIFFLPLRGNCPAYRRQCVTACTLTAKCWKHSTVLSWDLRLWLKWDMFRLLFWYWEATMFRLVEGQLGGGGKSCSVCAGICACAA